MHARGIFYSGGLNIKAVVKRVLPAPLQSLYIRSLTWQMQRQYKSLSLSEAFETIYARRAWGVESSGGTASSGIGSTSQYVKEYCALLEGLLPSYGIRSIADLGCGNFNVGRVVARMVSRYVGVDIARPIVNYNVAVHSNDHVLFFCADVASDPLPAAEAALVRQVLQHLSNSEITAALANILSTYPLVFITEHLYTGPDGVPNIDIPHGPGTRVPFRSGVFVDRFPFSLRVESATDIYCAPREVLRTWVVKGAGRQGYGGMSVSQFSLRGNSVVKSVDRSRSFNGD